MSTNFFLKKFLLNAHIIPELSQIYHHVYFRNLQEELVATNNLTARFMGFSNHAEIERRNYNELILNPIALKHVLDNDQIVLKNNQTSTVNEFITVKNKRVNFLSIKSPWHNENNVAGICGISIIMDGLNLGGLIDILSIIGNLLEGDVPTNSKSGLFAGDQRQRPELTSREVDCLYLYMKGNTIKDIANILGLSKRTIEFYVDNIKSKLGVNKRSELLHLAFNLYPDLV